MFRGVNLIFRRLRPVLIVAPLCAAFAQTAPEPTPAPVPTPTPMPVPVPGGVVVVPAPPTPGSHASS